MRLCPRYPIIKRHEDIPRLVQHFLKEACERFGTALKPLHKQLTPEAMRACVETGVRVKGLLGGLPCHNSPRLQATGNAVGLLPGLE